MLPKSDNLSDVDDKVETSVLHFTKDKEFHAKELTLSKAMQIGNEDWVVEEVLDYNNSKYLLLWHGNEQSWQPYQDLFDCPELVTQFWEEKEKAGIRIPREIQKQMKEMEAYANGENDDSEESEEDLPHTPRKRKILAQADVDYNKRRKIDSSNSDDSMDDVQDEDYDIAAISSRRSGRNAQRVGYADMDIGSAFSSDMSADEYYKKKKKKAKKIELIPDFLVDEILTHKVENTNGKEKILFACKMEDTSFHDIKWIEESKLSAQSNAKYRNYMKKKFNDNPISLEESFDKAYLNVHKVMIVEEDELVNDEIVLFHMIKWENLSYLYKTFETKVENLPGFQLAYDRYLLSLKCADEVLKRPPKKREFTQMMTQPKYIPDGLTLKTHQLSGVNRMLYNWSIKKSMILADEMGLGSFNSYRQNYSDYCFYQLSL
eukprot:NODE_164_length_14719_cov_1.036252.p5 type:complete len:432 gc:universal NODE_164_length_14719_cov_1.036252:4884-6179(+)